MAKTIGMLLLALALISAVLDMTRSIADSSIVFNPLGQDWANLSPSSLETLQAIVQRYILPQLWDPIILYILLLPTWAVLGVLALFFLYLGRKRKKDWQEKYGA